MLRNRLPVWGGPGSGVHACFNATAFKCPVLFGADHDPYLRFRHLSSFRNRYDAHPVWGGPGLGVQFCITPWWSGIRSYLAPIGSHLYVFGVCLDSDINMTYFRSGEVRGQGRHFVFSPGWSSIRSYLVPIWGHICVFGPFLPWSQNTIGVCSRVIQPFIGFVHIDKLRSSYSSQAEQLGTKYAIARVPPARVFGETPPNAQHLHKTPASVATKNGDFRSGFLT